MKKATRRAVQEPDGTFYTIPGYEHEGEPVRLNMTAILALHDINCAEEKIDQVEQSLCHLVALDPDRNKDVSGLYVLLIFALQEAREMINNCMQRVKLPKQGGAS